MFLASRMEPVEDIPQDAILNALPWNWESYGEYLDAITELFKKSGRSDESCRQPDFGHFRLLGGGISVSAVRRRNRIHNLFCLSSTTG